MGIPSFLTIRSEIFGPSRFTKKEFEAAPTKIWPQDLFLCTSAVTLASSLSLACSFSPFIIASKIARGLIRAKASVSRLRPGFSSFAASLISDSKSITLLKSRLLLYKRSTAFETLHDIILSISLKSNCTFTPKAASRCLEIYCSRYSSRVSSVYSRRVFCLYRRLLQQKLISNRSIAYAFANIAIETDRFSLSCLADPASSVQDCSLQEHFE